MIFRYQFAQYILIRADLRFQLGKKSAEAFAFIQLRTVSNQFQRANGAGELVV
jgi:hypothetical protein